MKNEYIPPEKAKELNKILGFPPSDTSDTSDKPKKEKIRIEGDPDPHANVTDPKLKKFLDEARAEFDPRCY